MIERINSQGQLSGNAAQEVEKVQMGGTSTAVGGFLQGVAGNVTGSSTKRSTPASIRQ